MFTIQGRTYSHDGVARLLSRLQVVPDLTNVQLISSTKSKELKPDVHFATFGKIFTNPKSQTIPITAAGAAHLDTFTSFIAKWQAGSVKDLTGGLKDVDKQIDAKLKQAGAGGTP